MSKNYIWVIVSILLVLYGCGPYEPKPIDLRDKFVGSYNASENSYALQTTSTFKITISKSAQPDSIIYIKNFYNAGLEIQAQVSGGKLSIPLQHFNNYDIEGLGSLNENELILSYTVRHIKSNFYDDCLTKCTK